MSLVFLARGVGIYLSYVCRLITRLLNLMSESLSIGGVQLGLLL